MVFLWIFLAVVFTVVVLFMSLWLLESEEEHEEEVALREHLETEQEAIEFEEYQMKKTRTSKRKRTS